MYEFIPKTDKKKTKNAVSALVLGGIAIFIVTLISDSMPFKWIFQTVGLVLVTAGIFFMTRYLTKEFLYRVAPSGSGADLTVTELTRKSRITVCRISLCNIARLEVFSSSEKDKEKALVSSFKKEGRKRFDYCADPKPEKFVWIVANECGEEIAVKLSYDKTLCKLINPQTE